MPFTLGLRRFGVVALLACPPLACSSGEPTGPVVESERSVALNLDATTLAPGQVTRARTGGEALFTGEVYLGRTAAGIEVPFAVVDSVTLAFALPLGVTPGTVVIELVETDVWRSTVQVEATALVPPADPEALLFETLTLVDASVAELAALAGDSTTAAGAGFEFAAMVAAELRAWNDTAAFASQSEVAALLQANGLGAAAPLAALNTSGEESCSASSGMGAALKLVGCQAHASQALGQASVATLAAVTICYLEPTKGACLITGGIAAVAILRARDHVERMIDQPGVALGEILASFQERLGLVLASASGPSLQTSDGFVFDAGQPYGLSADAEFRTMIDSDGGLHPALAEALGVVSGLRRLWDRAAVVVEAVRSFLPIGAPELPAAPRVVPQGPLRSVSEGLPSGSLRVEDVSGPVTVDFDPSTGDLQVTTSEVVETPFSFQLVHDYPFGTLRSPVQARVRPATYRVALAGGGVVTEEVRFAPGFPVYFVLVGEDGNPASGIDYGQVTISGGGDGVSFQVSGSQGLFAVTVMSAPATDVSTSFDVQYRGGTIQTVQARVVVQYPLVYEQAGVVSFSSLIGNDADGCQYYHTMSGGSARVVYGELGLDGATRPVTITVSGSVLREAYPGQPGCTTNQVDIAETFSGVASADFRYTFVLQQRFLGWTEVHIDGYAAGRSGGEASHVAYVTLDLYPGYGGGRPRTSFSVNAVS